MRVIGIDPGYDRLGVAVLEYTNNKEILLFSGCIKTEKTDSLVVRLHKLGVEFKALLEQYQPDTLAIEKIFFNTNQKTAIGVAEARGVIIYLAKDKGCGIYEFGPRK